MQKAIVLFLLALSAFPAFAQEKPADKTNPANLTIALEPLGDTEAGVVVRITFKFRLTEDVPQGVPVVIQGSAVGASGVRNFRYPLPDNAPQALTAILTVPAGEVEVDARLMIPLEEQAPVIISKATQKFTVAKTGKEFIAGENATAEAVMAEGIVPEAAGAVKIVNPRRDVAPNLFIVNVEVKPPVKRVEFWVEGKKILARNAPPYRAELDLGSIPKRVEVRAVGYDAQGRYVDADAFIVNERDTQLEVKITRTNTPDGMTHLKLSVQNPKNSNLKSIVLFAGQKKFHEWTAPPYALSVPTARLEGIDFLRASVTDDTGYEAADLLFLSGDRYTEEIEVNLVELPVTVTDQAGVPIAGLVRENFTVLENGKPQKISDFNFASNLSLSVGVLVDHSGSMQPRMKQAKDAAVAFFRNIIKPNDRAFIGAFAFDATKLAPFVSDVPSLEQQVASIPEAAGGTALYDAIVTGLYRFRNVQGRKALIIVTDGEDTTSRLPYEEMLAYVRASRVPLYFIGLDLGFGNIAGTSKMKSLAAETGGVAYFTNIKNINETYAALEKDLRSQYLVSYYTESTKKDVAYRTVDVKVDRPDAKVRTIRGFIP